ncbi:MAG: helix-turn-helix domain-containing protein [Chitinophagaceae bacterium]
MIYKEFYPSSLLTDVVECYYYLKINTGEEIVQHFATPLLQGLCINFSKERSCRMSDKEMISLNRAAYIHGQASVPRMMTTSEKGEEALCVKFKALGIAKLTGINMAHLSNQIVCAEDIWGKEIESLSDAVQSEPTIEKGVALVEKFLLRKYLSTALYDRVSNVQKAVEVINSYQGNLDIKLLQHKANTTPKTLERNFLHYLGLSPKLYARIVRFNAVKAEMDQSASNIKLTSLAHQFGFYDSSHFTAEFKHFSGHLPLAYIKKRKDASLNTINLI